VRADQDAQDVNMMMLFALMYRICDGEGVLSRSLPSASSSAWMLQSSVSNLGDCFDI
jgi:hypothetical protein